MKLTEICDFQGGSQPPKNEWSDVPRAGYIRMLQIRDYTQENPKIEYVRVTNSTKKCEEKDILIARYGASIGKILTGLSGAYNVAMMKVIIDENIVDRNYIYNFLKSNIFQNYIKNVGQRAAQAGFNKEELSRINVNLPTLNKQKKIAKELNKIQEVIDIRKKQIEELDQLIKSQFFDRFEGIKEKVRLGNCCEVHARIGWQALTKNEHLKNGKYMLITGTDFKDNEIDYNTCVYVTKERYEMDKHIILRNNDILITKDGTIGKVAIVHDLDKPATLNSGVFVVRPDNRFNKEYIAYVFKGPIFEEFVDKSKTGATIKHLNQKHLVEFEIPLPSIKLQNEFANFYKLIDKQKNNLQKSLEKMEKLQESLMNKYFG